MALRVQGKRRPERRRPEERSGCFVKVDLCDNEEALTVEKEAI